MKRSNKEIIKMMSIIQNDSNSLYDRLISREKEYLKILSLKRTRSHFQELFKSHYDTIRIEELKCFSVDLINAINSFYLVVADLKWYLSYTEDMPMVVQDKIEIELKNLDKCYSTLKTYLSAEMSLEVE